MYFKYSESIDSVYGACSVSLTPGQEATPIAGNYTRPSGLERETISL